MPRHSHHYEHMLPELGDTSGLTPRQRDVVDLMRKGLNDREIEVAILHPVLTEVLRVGHARRGGERADQHHDV